MIGTEMEAYNYRGGIYRDRSGRGGAGHGRGDSGYYGRGNGCYGRARDGDHGGVCVARC